MFYQIELVMIGCAKSVLNFGELHIKGIGKKKRQQKNREQKMNKQIGVNELHTDKRCNEGGRENLRVT